MKLLRGKSNKRGNVMSESESESERCESESERCESEKDMGES